MGKVIRFVFKWIIPIGVVHLICKHNDKILDKDNVGKQTYWRLYDSDNGAGLLIRRS